MIRRSSAMVMALAIALSFAAVSTVQARGGDHVARTHDGRHAQKIPHKDFASEQRAAVDGDVATDAIDRLPKKFDIKVRDREPQGNRR